MLKTAWVSGAGFYPSTGIDPKLQTFTVDIVTESLHTTGEFHRIRYQPLVEIPNFKPLPWT